MSVSATTRRPRPGETQGVDYHFISDEEFARQGRRRASSSSGPSTAAAATGRCARSWTATPPAAIRSSWRSRSRARARCARRCPSATQIFIEPPDEATLRERLIGRGTDDPEQVERRLKVAEEELAAAGEFEHVVVNDRLHDAAEQLESIVRGTMTA